MQPSPQRRHDGSYVPMPGQMRPHPGYQPYYHPQMGPMMSPYPQQYPPNWYGYQQPPMTHSPAALHQNRSYLHYMQGPQIPPQYAQHHAPMAIPSHPHAQPSPRPMHQQLPQIHQAPPPALSTPQSSVSSSVPVQAPPSPPLSTPGSSVLQKSSRASTPLVDVAPMSVEPARPSSPYYPPVSFEDSLRITNIVLTSDSYPGSPPMTNHSPNVQRSERGRLRGPC